jgi:hypothetical protein
MFRGNELGAGLVDANALNIRSNTQAVEQRQVQGQQRLADVEARVPVSFQQDDMAPPLGKDCRDRGAGRPTAYNEDIAFYPCPESVITFASLAFFLFDTRHSKFVAQPALADRPSAQIASAVSGWFQQVAAVG